MNVEPNILRIIARFIAIIGIIVLLASAALEILPVLPNNVLTTVSTIHRVNQQGALAERIDKDVLTLAYRPQAEHAQSLSELQVTLPVFEKIQAGLQSGDASLNLPTHRPQDVQLLLLQTQSDYIAIDASAKTILAHADQPVDLDQIAIIQQHEHDYFVAMGTIAKTWEGDIESDALGFFWTEFWMSAILLFLVLLWNKLSAINRIIQRVVGRLAQRKGAKP
jgi:hypothetical protein